MERHRHTRSSLPATPVIALMLVSVIPAAAAQQDRSGSGPVEPGRIAHLEWSEYWLWGETWRDDHVDVDGDGYDETYAADYDYDDYDRDYVYDHDYGWLENAARRYDQRGRATDAIIHDPAFYSDDFVYEQGPHTAGRHAGAADDAEPARSRGTTTQDHSQKP